GHGTSVSKATPARTSTRLCGDFLRTLTPTKQRIKGIPGAGLSFFQTDIDISGGKDPRTSLNITDGFLQQLEETGTDAMAYLTIYPFKGFDGVTNDHLTDLADRLKRLLTRGRSLFLRLYPEMNGSWFVYGQQPLDFIAAWRRAHDTLTRLLGPDLRDRVAFVWAPNSGNGYPYPGGAWSPAAADLERIRMLDTNGDGVLDGLDNPYAPYYPGDEYVDWVGLSIYHYGKEYPWITNDVPEDNKFEGLLQGAHNPKWGLYPFYTHFSDTGLPGVTRGNKPFILAEGGAAYHYAWSPDAVSKYAPRPAPDTTTRRADIKRAFWRQFLGKAVVARYPNLRAVCTFEFVKWEEDTFRDFTNFGMPAPNATGVGAVEAGSREEADETARWFVEDVGEGVLAEVQWAKAWTPPAVVAVTAGVGAGGEGQPGVVVVVEAPPPPKPKATTVASEARGVRGWMVAAVGAGLVGVWWLF
ncbi:hypothetical protein HDU96_000719, partial [Phlyctochytrium bullatum]